MAQVIWAPSARRDLHAIHDHIALDSVFYAQRFVNFIDDRVLFLGMHPMMGHIVKEFGDRRIREISVGAYRIIHRVTITEVQIIRVFHSKRKLRDRDLEG